MSGKQKILVIDDVKNVRESIKAILIMEGYDVHDLDSVQAADELDDLASFDLIITDMIMPEQEGSHIFDILENQGIEIPVLAMSGGGAGISAQLALKAAEDKARAMLKKPFSAAEIKQAVQNILI